MGKFEIRDNFYLNGLPFQIISGSMHYFRVLPEYWRDRLEKLAAMGCNTVETYVPWNMHEPANGVFDFKGAHGMLDLEAFIKIAGELGLYVIVRPSPYICAEWEFGGQPAWLLKEDGIQLRTSDPRYLSYVKRYYKALLPRLAPLQIHRGGPIIMMQVENEYGSFGNDKAYLQALHDMMREEGISVPLFASDGAEHSMLSNTAVADIFPTANFGSRGKEAFEVLRQYNHGGPCMCTEFWIGWFDHWKDPTHNPGNPVAMTAVTLQEILEEGHVNFYMFMGGTNFGFMNGSNYFEKLEADVTSYDYAALLTEDGQITEKYRKLREVILRFLPEEKKRQLRDPETFPGRDAAAYGELRVAAKVGLLEALEDISTPIETVTPLSMERHGQNYGYILYTSKLDTVRTLGKVRLFQGADRAIACLDKQKLFTAEDLELLQDQCFQEQECGDKQLSILVENMGRVNYGPRMLSQRKGIDGGVFLNGTFFQHNWKTYCLPLNNTDRLDYTRGYTEGLPGFYKFEFMADCVKDTFLDYSGWGKGVAFVNGFPLGRFWEAGPQRRLYVPGALLQEGKNEIVLFETEGKQAGCIRLEAEPALG